MKDLDLINGSRKVVGWLAIIYGAMTIGFLIPDLYMLIIEGAKPGEPIYLDHLASEPNKAVLSILFGIILVILGFVARPRKSDNRISHE